MKKFYFLFLLCCISVFSFGQTVAISPTGDGGFETGSTFAANGWTLVNHSNHQWFLGSGGGIFSGARSAYVSQDGGVSNTYNTGLSQTSHFYRDITIPTGANTITLTFYIKGSGETGWDRLLVYTAPTSVTPTAGTPASSSAVLTGATNVYTQATFYGAYTLVTVTLPNTLAGTTVRLIFTWQNDTSIGTMPAAAVDNIGLTYIVPAPLLAASPAALSFGGVAVGSSSSTQSFVLTGTNLTGAPGNVTVTAPAGYQISLEGTLWFSSLTYPYSTTTLGPYTVFVRFNPTALGLVSGNITITGGGAPTLNVPVTGSGANLCAGAPTAGAAAVTPSGGASATPFFLSLTGASTSAGLTYQWQSAASAGGPYTNITGATNSTYSFTGISATTYYQCIVTCPSFGSATSSNIAANFITPTYCLPSYLTTCGGLAMPCSIASLVGASGSITDPSTVCGATGPNNYTNNYATMSVTLAQGSTYTANIGGNVYGSNYSVQIWIDFNDDGTFASPGEVIGGGVTPSTASSGGNPMVLTIPAAATPGTHRMRIVGNYHACCGGVNYPGIPSCVTSPITYGETRDYKVIITSTCTTPAPITGTNFVCFPGNSTLSSLTSGGTWTSSNTAVATVVASTGVVTGIAAGPATVTYTVAGGCFVTRPIGVYGKPTVASVTASANTLCANTPVTFTAGATTGTIVSYNWSGPSSYAVSTTANNTTYTPTAPIASGIYSLTVTNTAGCVSNPVMTSPSVTVTQAPSPFIGAHTVCVGSTVALSNTVIGGTWTQASSSIGTIGASSGVLTGISAGLTTITYTLPNTCSLVEQVTVNPLPGLTITPSAATTICMGETSTFTANSPNPTFALLSQNFDAGIAGGWSVTNLSATTPLSWWQSVTPPGVDGTAGDGSPMLQAASSLYTGIFTETRLTSPSFSTLGYGSATLSFDQYIISTVPDAIVLIEYSTDNGSTWVTLLDQLNAFGGSPSWTTSTGDDATIALPAGALGQPNVRLRWNYKASSFYWFLDNIAVTAQLPASTYAWTGPLGLSCTTCTTPDITPTSNGANVYSITVTSSAGCTTTSSVNVSVNPLPANITGNLSVCVGSTNMLSSTVGGTWMSSDVSKATIDMTTGAMTGIDIGVVDITYTLPTGCMTYTTATVIPAPASITGPTTVCQGLTITLSQATSGGVWATSAAGVATVNSFGVVTGVAPGNATITYTLPSGCYTSTDVTVNPLPSAITGIAVVCKDGSSTLSNSTPGGFWSSNSTATATVDVFGTVTGVSNGNAIITYTLPTTCIATRIFTVNALPADITGATNVCQGGTATVSNATAGGAWSSSDITVAAINASGIVSGFNAGAATLTYTIGATGCYKTRGFVVNPLPASSTGIMSVCVGDMTTLSNSSFGGTWSSSAPATLSIDPSTGVATGMNAGFATVTYTLPTGCRTTSNATVNALPLAISGTPVVCKDQTTTVYDFTPGGSWISGNTAIATIDAFGLIYGVDAGLAQITYQLPNGCLTTAVATVNPLPGAITGTPQVCLGVTTTLSDPDGGGTWTSSNSAVASVGNTTGVVTGNSVGGATITYTLPTGCSTTQGVVVNPLPANITGNATVCVGLTTTLGNTSIGGIWTSSDIGVATVDAFGVVTGQGQGFANITYTLPTGCERVREVTVNPNPSSIIGLDHVCANGGISSLFSSPSGGAWTSGSSVIAAVNASGTVTGYTAGVTNITYTLPTGCRSTMLFTVNALPAPITGATNVCVASNITLSTTTPGVTWGESTFGVIATMDAFTGVLTGASQGSTTVTATSMEGCIRTTNVVVNPLPAPILGLLNVCSGTSTSLTNATPGGAWSSSAPSIASINTAGVAIGVSSLGGVATISYTLPTTCRSTASIVVNPLPANIAGTTTMCKDQSVTLTNTSIGGNWYSSNTTVAPVDISTGVVTGLSAGNAVITYMLSTGCQKTIAVLVNPLPGAITGNRVICQGNVTVLGNSSVGGTWVSSDPLVAPISASGIVTAINPGTTDITYTLPTGCSTNSTVTVNALPEAITGTPVVCAGLTTTLEDATPGGTWSAATSVVQITPAGVATGIAAGTTTITYSLGNNCRTTLVVSVNPLPSLIAGVPSVCPDMTTVLSNAYAGGAWTSGATDVATVGAATGIVSGVTPGVANITYTLPTGCLRYKTITVQPTMEAITGTTNVCFGLTTTLSNATPGGVWISGNTSVATVGASTGVVTGVAAGAAIVTYSMPTGCLKIATVAVNPLPANITGPLAVCAGSTANLNNTSTGGVWTGSTSSVATIGSASGIVTGVASGVDTITYTLATGCKKTTTIAVNALPTLNAVTGGGSYCAGGTGVHVGLDGQQTGVTYKLWYGLTNSATVVGGASGSLDFGSVTSAGTYNVTAITTAGCSRPMTGSATVTINPLVTPSISMTSTAVGDSICAGTNVTFTANGSNGGTTPTYSWSVNGGTPVASTGTYSFAPANGDVVKVTYTSSEACPSPSSVWAARTMTVMANLTPSISISVGPDDTVCQGSTAVYNAVITNGGDAPTYTWNVGGSNIAGNNFPWYSNVPTNGQNIICKLNSNYRCLSTNNVNSNAINMHVETRFIPIVSIIAHPGTVAEQGQTVKFTTNVTNAGSAPKYQWMINRNVLIGETDSTYTGNKFVDGDSVTCIVYGTGQCGLATINSVVMKITEPTGVAHTGIGNSDIKLMPNPNNGQFVVTGTLGTTATQELTFVVTDVLGQVVYTGTGIARNGVINESIQMNNTLANGMYMLNVTAGAEHKVFHFVVKQ